MEVACRSAKKKTPIGRKAKFVTKRDILSDTGGIYKTMTES